MHVPQVVLALEVVLVLAGELVLIVELEEQGEELEELDDDLVVAFLLGRKWLKVVSTRLGYILYRN